MLSDASYYIPKEIELKRRANDDHLHFLKTEETNQPVTENSVSKKTNYIKRKWKDTHGIIGRHFKRKNGMTVFRQDQIYVRQN